MKRAALFLSALLALPLLWALGRTFLIGLSAGTVDGALLTPPRLAFFAGCLLMVGYYLWKGREWSILYVFAHEMTHALAGIFFLARIHRINVRETGGFVELSKSNLLITLAPYCLPFYLLLALVLCRLVTVFLTDAVPPELWSGLFGFLACFHVFYTVDSLLSVDQPDIQEYGRFFSCCFILAVNLLFAILSLSLSGIVPLKTQAQTVRTETCRAYGSTFSALRTLVCNARDAVTTLSVPTREASHESDR